MRTRSVVAILVAWLATAAPAAEPPGPAVLQAGLAGAWRGTLGYRDYQTDKLSELPVTTEVTALADGVSVIRVSTFDDGPRVGAVTITGASLHDPRAGTVATATLRRGRPVEVSTDSVAVTAFADATHWTIRFERDGEDDDAPARLRTTETRDGDTLVAIKEVLPVGTAAAGWRFRNRTDLRRAAAPLTPSN